MQKERENEAVSKQLLHLYYEWLLFSENQAAKDATLMRFFNEIVVVKN